MIRKSFYYILLILVVLLVVLLLIKNPEKVEFHYLFIGTKKISIGLLMFSAFVIGVLVGAAIMSISWAKQKIHSKVTKRKLVKIEKEVEALKSTPQKDVI